MDEDRVEELIGKIYLLNDENRELLFKIARIMQEKSRLYVENKIMQKILKENGLWETLLNDDEFIKYLREEEGR